MVLPRVERAGRAGQRDPNWQLRTMSASKATRFEPVGHGRGGLDAAGASRVESDVSLTPDDGSALVIAQRWTTLS